jgi:hypothetical protein
VAPTYDSQSAHVPSLAQFNIPYFEYSSSRLRDHHSIVVDDADIVDGARYQPNIGRESPAVNVIKGQDNNIRGVITELEDGGCDTENVDKFQEQEDWWRWVGIWWLMKERYLLSLRWVKTCWIVLGHSVVIQWSMAEACDGLLLN